MVSLFGPSDSVTDESLLASIADGDDRAAVAFVRRYQRRVFGLACSIVGDPVAAEDVAQEAFLRVFRHALVFDPRRAAVSTWVLTITRNLAIDSLRVRRGVPVGPDDAVWMRLTATDRPPDEVALATDSTDAIVSALSRLPLDQRRAVVLASMYGRTAAEVAEHESIPLGTAKGRIRAGLAKLRVELVQEGSHE